VTGKNSDIDIQQIDVVGVAVHVEDARVKLIFPLNVLFV